MKNYGKMSFRTSSRASFGALNVIAIVATCSAQTVVNVNVLTNRHPISPYIYGASFPTAAQLQDLNMPNCRLGGNNSSRYNWLLNCDNRGSDWYFESYGDASSVAGERGDTFIANAKSNNAQPMVTVPMLPYIGNIGVGRSSLRSFSVAKYGPQTGADPYQLDAGNGVSTASGNPFITGNDPTDANVANSPTIQSNWVQHIISKWGLSSAGGLKYYIMDNEPSIWSATHRDIHPYLETYDEIWGMYQTYALAVRNLDPTAVIIGPEEWGWTGYFYSGYDSAAGSASGWTNLPDRAAHGNLDHIPWLLQQCKSYQTTHGKRLLDVLSVHYYPQQGETNGDDSSAMQAIRNRSTRSLWDPNYTDTSWINSVVQLIPRLKNWVSTYNPGLQTAITEYNWGDDSNLNGGTTQADILGIFGREGLDYGSRWGTPNAGTPAAVAFKMYRNYDGGNSTFGDVSVQCTAPDPDMLSAFAGHRSSDGSITIMVVNKVTSSAPVSLHVGGLPTLGPATVYQLSNNIQTSPRRISNVSTTGGVITTTVPGQSVTLFVVPSEKLSLSIPNPGQVAASEGGTVTYPVVAFDLGNPGATISGSVLHGPSWASYDGHTLTLSPTTTDRSGDYPIILEATEPGSNSAPVTSSFMIMLSLPQIQSATFPSPSVGSGESTTLTIKLSSPAPHGGLVVKIASSGPLSLPSQVTIPEASTSIGVTAEAATVTVPAFAYVTASYGARTMQATLRVLPGH